ncbi:MAG TPA: Rieske 2Fe-2S domain-containing protein [Dehalococcoidia bacterium]|nr:Rieske 2Fe-2S domain-containing protein [Dehalococcoidia bacterium]
MLSAQDNELLTRTGPGTPMGELFRRFWLPALLIDELPAPDCAPIRFRILSENLVAFRDSDGRVGFLRENCPHRGASLFFGRNEECGLRCVYHGWKFDVNGDCVDMPSEPAESVFKSKVHASAYPGVEHGGLVWIYMGPKEKQPELPRYEWTLRPSLETMQFYKWMQESNYAQGIEGNIDTAHVGFLHKNLELNAVGSQRIPVAFSNTPELQLRETEFGFVYGGRRDTDDGQYYWRVTPFVLPAFTSIPNPRWGGGGIFVIPMDDEHCWWWYISEVVPPYETTAYIELEEKGWRQTRNKDNDYLIDREMQRTVNFTGMPTNRVQDAAVTESMGPINDRTTEHLGTSDMAIIYMRRLMIRLAKQLQAGIEPSLPQQADAFRVRPVHLITSEAEIDPIWEGDRAAHLSPPEPIAVETPAS